MSRPDVAVAVAVCRVVLGDVSADMADALAAAEAWAGGEPSSPEEYADHYAAARGVDERGEAVCWALSAAFDRDAAESAFCVEQALATLAALPGWSAEAVADIFGRLMSPRATIPVAA
ncbi:hypothetical protein WMF01_12280 [Sorangium sp. So ce1667]